MLDYDLGGIRTEPGDALTDRMRALVLAVRHDDPRGPAMLSAVFRSLAPTMVAHGLASEDELDLDTLSTRLADSLAVAGSVLVPPILVAAWGRAT